MNVSSERMTSPTQRRSPSDSSAAEDQRIATTIVRDSGSSKEIEESQADPCRGAWGNQVNFWKQLWERSNESFLQIEFLLSTLGMAVGLGNIWRFPTRAYNNGGCKLSVSVWSKIRVLAAFLVPYVACALLFGLPAVYLEFLLGQYHRTTAPIIFRRFAPILQG